MLRKIGIPLLALAGICFGIFMIYVGKQKPPVAHILFPASESPYKYYIAGDGVIESAYKNIMLGVPFPQLITHIYVSVGTVVHRDDPLFKLDTRHLEAQLVEALQQEKVAQMTYENQCVQFSFYERLQDRSAVSEQAYQTAFYNKVTAYTQWQAAKAHVNVIATDIERSTIRAPIDGQVLQINIRIGEFANLNPFTQLPLMVFGDTDYYHLRVNIDEEDSWRIISGAQATAFIRGHAVTSIPLEFAYAEPMLVAKTALSGAATEIVDTRVVQLVYKFSKNSYPIYIGQLLDVYVEAKPSEAAR